MRFHWLAHMPGKVRALYGGSVVTGLLVLFNLPGVAGNVSGWASWLRWFRHHHWALFTVALVAWLLTTSWLTLEIRRPHKAGVESALVDRPPRPRGVSEAEWIAARPAAIEAAKQVIAFDVATEKPTPLQQLYASSVRERTQREIGELREEGTALHKALFVHKRDSRRSALLPLPGPPQGYLDRVAAWNSRLLAFADPQLPEREQADIAPYPKLLAALGGLGMPTFFDELDKMFLNNLGVLTKIERSL